MPLLGQVPLQPELAGLADRGQPALIAEPQSPASMVLRAVAEQVHQLAQAHGVTLPVMNG